MAVRRDKNGRWRYRKMVRLPDGRKVRISGCPTINTKAEAEAEEHAHIQRVKNPLPPRKEVPKFRKFSEEFMTTYAAANNKPSEQQNKRYLLKAHLLDEFGSSRLDQIGPHDIEKFKAELLRSGRHPKSVNNILAVLGRILSYAYEIGILDRATRIRRIKAPSLRLDFLDFDEYERLREANRVELELYAAILVAGDAGLRRGEIMGLARADIDSRNQILTVRQSLWREKLTDTKGHRERPVEMTKRLAVALKAIAHLKGPRMFCRDDGTAWNEEVMRAAIKRAAKRAGLRAIGWHTLRHTFCSHLAMKGVPARVIQELAGHSDLQTTMRYMHLSPAARREAVHVLEGGVAKTWQKEKNDQSESEKSQRDSSA